MPKLLSNSVRAADVAVVPAAVVRSVLPLVYDETLVAGCIVEEERGHRARHWVARSEMGVDEGSRIATSVSHGNSVTMSIKRCLHFTGRKRNDEVAVQAPRYAIIHCALGSS